MIQTLSGYILGIGSNLDPQHNIGRIIHALLKSFPTISLSRVIKLPPIGMNSPHDFLNLVIFIETDMKSSNLKVICNDIETSLGRNRNDPNSKIKDRPADLDILTSAYFPDDKSRLISSITDEYFLYPLIEELVAYLMADDFETSLQGIEITIDGLTFGQTATTINRNNGTRNKRVVQKTFHR